MTIDQLKKILTELNSKRLDIYTNAYETVLGLETSLDEDKNEDGTFIRFSDVQSILENNLK